VTNGEQTKAKDKTKAKQSIKLQQGKHSITEWAWRGVGAVG